jgi:hypothetical protein
MPATENTEVRTSVSRYEMADLLNLLADVKDGRKMSLRNRQLADELRESIIAGTPEHQRVTPA